jgi:OPA family glycerol-3-phosphate transporter-like MFS transporter
MEMREKQARRRLIATLTVGYAGYYLCRSNFSVTLPLLVEYLEETGLSAREASVALGSVASLGVLTYAVGKFLSGPFNDRFGGRAGFLGGMAGAVFFTILFAFAGGVPLFSLAWIGNRFVQSGGWVGMVQICSRWLPAASYASAMAIISQSFLFGDAAVRVGLGYLMALEVGWRTVFLVSAGLLLVLGLWASRELQGTPAARHLPEPPPHPENVFAKAAPGIGSGAIIRELLGSSSFRLVCVLSFGLTLLRETFNIWTPLYFVEAAGMEVAAAARWSAVFPFFGGVSVLAAGFLGDRVGRWGRTVVILLACLGSAAALYGLAALGGRPEPVSAVLLVSLVAVTTLAAYAYLAGATAIDLGGKVGSGTASGLIDGFGYLGGILAGRGVADLATNGGWAEAFVVLSVVALFCAVAGLWLSFVER